MHKKIMKVENSAGFTLVELMLTVSISVLVMASVMYNYSKFNNDLALSSASQEISVAIRQAQVYSLSVKERAVGAGDYTYGYGIYFSTASPQSYVIFSDAGPVPPSYSPDGKFDNGLSCGAAGADCIIETGVIRNNIRISAVCGVPFSGTLTCPPGAGLTSANITFTRPKTDAKIRFNNSSFGAVTGLYQTGVIVLSSPQGKYASTSIESTGQISVQ